MTINMTETEPLIKLFSQFNEQAWNIIINTSDHSDVPFERLYSEATSMIEEDSTLVQMSSSDDLAAWNQRHFLWIIASAILHVTIFLLGLITNGIFIFVVWKGKFLRIPAYCYLVSVAGADLLVLCTTLPMEIIISFKDQITFGQTGCAAFAVLSFLGINVGSISVLTFTVELQIAVCQPIVSYRVYRKTRTKTIIRYSWLAVFVYSATWLSFTDVTTFFTQSSSKLRSSSDCSLLMPLTAYISFFIIDFFLFYCIPLMVAVGVYVRLFVATKGKSRDPITVTAVALEQNRKVRLATGNSRRQTWIRTGKPGIARRTSEKDLRRTSMLRLLLVIVLICGVAWLPFRLIPAYKTFWTGPLLDTWFLFLSSTLVYMKCAVSPLIYILLSSKFRTAVRHHCLRHRQGK